MDNKATLQENNSRIDINNTDLLSILMTINNLPVHKEIKLQEKSITPSTTEQEVTADAGYTGLSRVTVAGDEDLIPENIREGTNILGIDGEYKGIDTSDATATGADLLKDKTAYANGKQITGTIEEYDGSLSGNVEIGDEDLIPENIREEVEILGVVGTAKISNVKITNASYLFNNGARIEQLNDILNLCENVTNTSHMFENCRNLTNLDLSNFSTSILTDSSYMFNQCNYLKSLILGNLNTSNVQEMNSMFNYCYNLTDLDLSSFDASKVYNIDYMFYYCRDLVNLKFMKNLGKGYKQKTSNYSNYRLYLNGSKNLTYESLMNVINNLYDLNLTYDVANGGTLYTQQLVLGNENLERITPEEIAIATSKGWTVS